MEETVIKATKEELVEAFRKWHQDRTENPDEYNKSMEEYSEEEYAQDCANQLIELLENK